VLLRYPVTCSSAHYTVVYASSIGKFCRVRHARPGNRVFSGWQGMSRVFVSGFYFSINQAQSGKDVAFVGLVEVTESRAPDGGAGMQAAAAQGVVIAVKPG